MATKNVSGDDARQKLQDTLETVGADVGTRFPESPRLAQFTSHLATVSMIVDHLFDEQDRHADH